MVRPKASSSRRSRRPSRTHQETVTSNGPVPVTRLPERLLSDDHRVITRPFEFSLRRRRAILGRIMQLDEDRVAKLLESTMARFASRHPHLHVAFQQNYEMVAGHLEHADTLSEARRQLIGAYFTMEYSIEAAALFNPSLVRHPDQRGAAEGELRFLMSLRATGEGHISSIVFRQGTISVKGEVEIDAAPPHASWARPQPDEFHDKRRFMRKLLRIEPHLALVRRVLDRLPERFRTAELEAVLDEMSRQPGISAVLPLVAEDMRWLAHAHYTLNFPPSSRPGENVIFPATEHEIRGMEDLRLVQCTQDDGQWMYHGTYTAYDGHRTLPMLLTTPDFKRFHICTLGGRYAEDKGMALFPRKVDGQYLMISRHDGESLYLLRSHDLEFWDEGERLQVPCEPWELIQIGNAGSPLETEHGWLLLTHGVGPVREYALGATLLDRHEPHRVIGQLRKPLLSPTPSEREGYVPNVVYSCGALIHRGDLILPYAVSDVATRFARIRLADLLDHLRASPPQC